MKDIWEKKIQQSGKRMTPIRRVLFRFFENCTSPVSLEDIQRKCFGKKHSADFATVYRQLETLVEEGILNRSDVPGKKQYYEVRNIHHHHFLCTKCQEIQCLQEQVIRESLEEVFFQIQKQGMEIDSHILSLSGTCKKCKGY